MRQSLQVEAERDDARGVPVDVIAEDQRRSTRRRRVGVCSCRARRAQGVRAGMLIARELVRVAQGQQMGDVREDESWELGSHQHAHERRHESEECQDSTALDEAYEPTPAYA